MAEKVRIKKLKNRKAFIDYSQTTDDVYNPPKKKKVKGKEKLPKNKVL